MSSSTRARHRGDLGRGYDAEPEKGVRTEWEEVRQRPNRRKRRTRPELDRHAPRPAREIHFHRLGISRQVADDEDRLVAILPNEDQRAPVLYRKELDRAAPERLILVPHHD